MAQTTLTLTDTQWMDLIDGSEDRENNLSRCCANISELRDVLMTVARDGGHVNVFAEQRLRETLGWVLDGHDVDDIPALLTVCDQLGIDHASLQHTPSSRPEKL